MQLLFNTVMSNKIKEVIFNFFVTDCITTAREVTDNCLFGWLVDWFISRIIKIYQTNFNETWWEDKIWTKEEPIKF